MKKITINGEELTITFNFATELSYEQLTGKAFDAADLIPSKEGGEPKSADIIKVAIACLIANNPDAATDSDYVLYKATRAEVRDLVTAVVAEMMTWLGVPAIAEAHTPAPDASPSEEDDEDNSPNA